MERSWKRARPLTWAVLVATLSLAFFPGTGLAEPADPAHSAAPAANPAQIVLIDGSLNIEVLGVSGTTVTNPPLWASPAAEAGWTNFATGDFNHDGDQEIVATKFDSVNNRGVITIYDPVLGRPQPAVLNGVSTFLGWGQSFHFVVTGDFMGIGQDQIVAAYDSTDGERLIEYYPINANATQWAMQDLGNFSFFASTWDVATAGDVNQDGRAELVLARNVDKDVLILTGQQNSQGAGSVWASLWENNQFCSDCNWYSLAVGRVFNTSSITGNQLVANRHSSSTSRNSTLIFSWNGSEMVDVTPGNTGDYFFNPNFTELALAKLDGTASAYNEIVQLRQVSPLYAPRAFMSMLNPANAAVPPFEPSGDYDPNSWAQVAAGDVRGVGRDQIIVLRGNTLRIYAQPWINTASFPDIIGSFRATNLVVARIGFSNDTPTVTPGGMTFWHETTGNGSNDILSGTITIQGPASGAMSWTATASPQPVWLSFSPTQGTTSSQPNLIQVTANPSQVGNQVGVYNAVITINPTPFRSDWVNTVTVKMVITPRVRHIYLPSIKR